MKELATARFARQRAGQIRQGMRDYLKTLALIKEAWDERDWEALGYHDWQTYVDGEFGADRLGLSPEHRQKAVAELRMAGMSTRAIAAAVGVAKGTVDNDLTQLANSGQLVNPDRVTSLDGRERPATMPQRQEVADQIVAEIDRQIAESPRPEPESHADGDARRDAELDAAMADTAVRFRRNLSAALSAAAKVWSFDADRIAEVYATDWDTDIQRGFIDEMRRWCDRAEAAHRARTGLRLVNGGRS